MATMILAASCTTKTGTAVVDLQSQQIGLSSVHNARQLGGYIIGDKQIKKDLLLRTARLSALSAEDSLLLTEKYKVQCIYDFRSAGEIQTAPDVIPGDSRHLPLSISFSDNGGQADYKVESDAQMIQMLLENAEHPKIQAMCEVMYDKIFFDESSQVVYRQFFADLLTLDPNDGAVLWHCTQGKDRAGCASAMLLAALGAERDLIVADFTLSKHYYDPHTAKIPTATEAQQKAISTLISANPTIFEATLDKVEARYGSLANYLTECIGVTPEMMETLRERFLEN
ncbi:MAG: tyrosine-protein phosphatase [Bacteroidaceae bacterium]|nr:tyrosine-protein phosphatase [Bacteroidaceae bacterium]